jgi:hypothetical protein
VRSRFRPDRSWNRFPLKPFVAEHANAKPPKLAQPCVSARKILVVARNEENAVAARICEWRTASRRTLTLPSTIAGDRKWAGALVRSTMSSTTSRPIAGQRRW